jgi:hypothetical protein
MLSLAIQCLSRSPSPSPLLTLDAKLAFCNFMGYYSYLLLCADCLPFIYGLALHFFFLTHVRYKKKRVLIYVAKKYECPRDIQDVDSVCRADTIYAEDMPEKIILEKK